jgi:hypothetical protein
MLAVLGRAVNACGAVWLAVRARLQTGEAGTGAGGLHGAVGSGDPPPLDLDLLCLQLLLAHLVP